MLFLLFIVVLAVIGLRAMTPEERERLRGQLLPAARQVVAVLRRRNPEWDGFRERLRGRTKIPVAAPAIVAVNVIVFLIARSKNAPLVDVGASFGPATTNGEWWRLVTSLGVHATLAALVVNTAALVSSGFVLERYVGSIAFAGVYLTAGIMGAAVNLHFHPIAVSAGAAPAIFGVYALLLACLLWTAQLRGAENALVIPVGGIVRLAPIAALFFLYSLANDGLALAAEFAAAAVGLGAGLVIANGVAVEKPAKRPAAVVALAAAVAAVVVSAPLRGMAYVEPEIDRVLAIEAKTAGDYDGMYDRFKRGRVTAQALAQGIERRILPELRDADARLKSLAHVPAEQRTLVADAQQYVELRAESWRLRAQALRTAGTVPVRDDKESRGLTDAEFRTRADARYRANAATFGKAEGAERASLEALQRVRDSRAAPADGRAPATEPRPAAVTERPTTNN